MRIFNNLDWQNPTDRGTNQGTDQEHMPRLSLAPLAAAIVLLLTAPAWAQQTPQPQPANPSPVTPRRVRPHHLKSEAEAQPAPAPAAPVVPTPQWPANEQPEKPEVKWDSHGLQIEATNASLRQILDEVATATGAKVEGMGNDERVFGEYGPGDARDVLAQLLHGSSYNVLMIGDQGAGTPREIVLSARHDGSNGGQPGANRPGSPENAGEDETPDQDDQGPPPPQVMQPPILPQPGAPGVPGNPRTPQQLMQELQQRQQQMQNEQQQNMPAAPIPSQPQ